MLKAMEEILKSMLSHFLSEQLFCFPARKRKTSTDDDKRFKKSTDYEPDNPRKRGRKAPDEETPSSFECKSMK
jgi:hypothetical protein